MQATSQTLALSRLCSTGPCYAAEVPDEPVCYAAHLRPKLGQASQPNAAAGHDQDECMNATLLRKATLLLALLVGSATAMCATTGSDYAPGDAWRRMEASSQMVWVWGVAEGQSLVVEELPKATASRLSNNVFIADAKAVSEIMAQNYNDPANAFVPWKYMVVVASKRLGGESEARLAERLRSLREYSNFERSRPRSQ